MGKIELEKNIITFLTRDMPSFELKQSFRVLRTVDRYAEPYNLTG
jgi:hypothetical protein